MKAGWKSTEFLMMVLFAVVMMANGTQYVNVDASTLNWFGGMVALYAGGRTGVKVVDRKATP